MATSEEIFKQILTTTKLFAYLEPKDLANLSKVSKSLRTLANNEELWKTHWQRLQAQLNPNENEPIEQSFSFKEKYGKVNKIITAKKNSAGNFYGIPHELMLHILSFLAAQGLTKVAEVSRFFRSVAEDDSLWLPILKQTYPKIPKPDDQSAKNFFQQLKSTYLERLFKEKYPEVVLETPLPQSTKFKTGFLASDEDKLKNSCIKGTDGDIADCLKKLRLKGPKSRPEVERLIVFINLALNNKKNKNAFKTLMNSFSDEDKRDLLNHIVLDHSFYYVILNFISQGITPFEIEKGVPLIISVLHTERMLKSKTEPLVTRLIRFLMAFDKESLIQCDRQNNTIFHLACRHRELDLIKHFVDDVSKVMPSLMTACNEYGDPGVVFLIGGIYDEDLDKRALLLNQIINIIHQCPELLKIKIKNHEEIYSIAELIVKYTRNIKIDIPDDIDNPQKFKDVFQAIDNYFLQKRGETLLHETIRHEHFINFYWIKEFGNSILEGKKYVNFTDRAGHTVLANAFIPSSIKSEIVKLLLEMKADPNVNLSQEPLLRIAVENNLKKVITLLLRNGADPDYECPPDKKSIWKLVKKDPELLEEVKQSYKKLGKPLPLSGAEKNEVIKKLIAENQKLMTKVKDLEEKESKPTMVDSATQTDSEELSPQLKK